MKKLILFLITTLITVSLGVFFTPSITADTSFADGPDPVGWPAWGISHIQYAGSGCPDGSVEGRLLKESPLTSILLSFDKLNPVFGPEISRRENRKYCSLTIHFEYPPKGLSYTINRVDFRGYAYLDPGTYGDFSTNYRFDENDATYLRRKLYAPYDDFFELRADVNSEWIFSPCGENKALKISISSRVRSQGDGTAYFLSNPDPDTPTYQQFFLRWRRCEQ